MRAPEPKTRRQAAECKVALRARAAVRCAENSEANVCISSLDTLPIDQQRAGRALMFAALSHYLGAVGAPPKTMTWNGRRWWLAAADRGRLQVSAEPGWPGLLSMLNALV